MLVHLTFYTDPFQEKRENHQMTEIELFEAIKHGATVLTANRRLAGFFKQKFAEFQQAHQQFVWPSPAIFSFQDYLLTRWSEFESQQLSATRQLLTPFQSQLLWQQIIANTAISGESLDDLLNLEATTNTAITAWELMHAWNLSLDTLPNPSGIDEYAFQQWARDYQEYLTKHDYFDSATLCHEIGYLLKNKNLMTTKPFIFSGFDSFTPQQTSFIAALELQNIDVIFFDFALTPGFIAQLPCLDEDEEMRLAASFCNQQVLQGHHSIAVVVPDLQQKRNAIERIFNSITAHFNISAGKALSDYPVIDAAFTLLSWTANPVALTLISYLIRSPFILGAETEFNVRQKLDRALKEYAHIEVSFEKLRTLSQKQQCSQFSIIMEHIAAQNLQAKRCNDWSDFFFQKLKNSGWPGERSISSEEFQTVERFQSLILEEFRALDAMHGKISFSNALDFLKKLCQQTIFQAKKIEQAPIQILGLLEASGMTFQTIWITGLTEQQLPVAPRLNPFLSMDMQRKLQMPHSSVEREYEFSKKLIERLTHSADKIILSFPAHHNDETINASPLIEAFTLTSQDALNLALSIPEQTNAAILEKIPDNAVPFHSDKEKSRGGSAILKEQSLCSFRAFAFYRLHCKSVPDAVFAMNPLERGNVTHKVLELFWNKMQSKENLRNNFSEEESSLFLGLLCKVIDDVLVHYDLPNAILDIEKQHLIELLLQYFKEELKREDFVVADIEKNIDITCKNFTLNLRIDRIDQLSDGTLAIIDYKTSECKESEWFGDRPTAPQLPLYAAYYQPTPTQLLFAQLKRGNCEFIGVSAAETELKNIKTLDKIKLTTNTWQQQIHEWKTTCEQLIEKFQQGNIVLDPHPKKNPCKECNVKMLCRITETKDYDAIPD